MIKFKGSHLEREVMLWAVRWFVGTMPLQLSSALGKLWKTTVGLNSIAERS
jgi:hypothetical protein